MASKTVSRLRSRLRRLNKARLQIFDVALLMLVGPPSGGKRVTLRQLLDRPRAPQLPPDKVGDGPRLRYALKIILVIQGELPNSSASRCSVGSVGVSPTKCRPPAISAETSRDMSFPGPGLHALHIDNAR